MPVTDYKMLYESTLAAKQELEAQHKLLGDEVKRLKAEREALASTLEIAKLAIEYKDAAAITERRVNDPDFLEKADAADLDEIDLEEILARMKLFNAIHECEQKGGAA